MLAQIFEIVMLICFGLSWPSNIIKSIRSRTAKGRSIVFLYFVTVGYIAGIVAKIVGGNVNYVLAFYCINLLMVLVDMGFYYRNVRLDKKRDTEKIDLAKHENLMTQNENVSFKAETCKSDYVDLANEKNTKSAE